MGLRDRLPRIQPSGRADIGAAPGPGAERRAASRIAVPYLRCWSPTVGAILDLSRSGLRIETFRPFQTGDSIFLTSDLVGRTRRILGQVRWCRQIARAGKGRSPVFHVGIALDKPLDTPWLSAVERATGQDLGGT